MDKIVAKLNGLLEDIASEEDVPLADAEAYVSQTFRSVQQECLEERFSRITRPKEEEPIECSECEQPCVPLRPQPKHFVTVCGGICVHRWVSQCEEGHRHAPWDLKQALLDKYSRCVAEKMCRLAMLLDYREAALAFREKGYQIGSGVIESACPHGVVQRCPQASMRWKETGPNAMLDWICLSKNDSWD